MYFTVPKEIGHYRLRLELTSFDHFVLRGQQTLFLEWRDKPEPVVPANS
jgi:hypothetical protein